MSHLYVPNAGNLLDYASATLDTSVGFWTGSASTRAVNTSDPYAGAGCLEATATGSAQFYVSASKTVQVTPGQPYTLTYAAKSATRNLQVYFTWTNATGGTVLDQGITKGACTSWTVFSDTRVAPAGATCVSIHFYAMTAGSAGDTLLLDRIGLWAGAGGQWAPPGYPINGVGQYTDNTAGKATYLWDETVPGWRLAVYDSGWRDVSAALEAGASGTLLIRRTATNVHVLSFNVTNSSGTIYIAPAGFAPGSGTDGIAAPVVKFDGTVGAMTFNSPAGGHMALSAGIKAYAGAYLSAVFPVRTAIPTSLPGTQATAPV